MIKLALIGKNISHSLSPSFYKNFFNEKVDYDLIDISNESKLPSLENLKQKYLGVNITSPYKKSYLKKTVISDEIKNLGSINCIDLKTNEFNATNTDWLAVESLSTKILENDFENVLLLGSGSMAELFVQLFRMKKLNYHHFFRKKDGPLEKIDLLPYNKSLVINCCSRDFIFNGCLNINSIFWDMNYSFKPHQDFFSFAKITYLDGRELLEKQALEAIKFWGLN